MHLRNPAKEKEPSYYTKNQSDWDEWGEAWEPEDQHKDPKTDKVVSSGPKMLVSGNKQPTLDLNTVVTRVECSRKKVVPLDQVPTIEYKDERIKGDRREKIEKACKACLAWSSLSAATNFMQALETLGCLQEKGSGEDSKDRHLKPHADDWQRPNADWAAIQDPQNREQREWKSALLTVNKILQPYGCNLPLLRKGFEKQGMVGFLLTGIPLLGQNFQTALFRLIAVQVQIHNALLGLMLGKRDWMGDIDHKAWDALDIKEREWATLLKFDKQSWGRRSHTPITKQRWNVLRPV
eukprot:COSAG06_NODE_17420_length_942_cov_1.023725_1_plen_293_part_10